MDAEALLACFGSLRVGCLSNFQSNVHSGVLDCAPLDVADEFALTRLGLAAVDGAPLKLA